MQPRFLVITGTDTGVGKTRLACALVRHLRREGMRVCALKPICSGGREDAESLCQAAGGVLRLEAVNPWHFRAPLAPVTAARRERKRVDLARVISHTRRVAEGSQVAVVEGAGGLLSPLGEVFCTRDLITRLRAVPLVAGFNRLGALNQVLLVLAALPQGARRQAQVVLMEQDRPDLSAASNLSFLAERIGPARLHSMPWLRSRADESAWEASLGRLVRSCLGVGE